MLEFQGRTVVTVAEFAENIAKVTPATAANWVKKYKEKGGELESPYSVGNIVFFYLDDLKTVQSEIQRPAGRPVAKKTVPMMDYLHLEALLENERHNVDNLIEAGERLLARAMQAENLLSALDQVGVDNWDGYSDALKLARGEISKDDI